MSRAVPSDCVHVSAASYASGDAYAIVQSVIDHVNAAAAAGARAEDHHPDALRAYYVDYFAAELGNGGFSQFVYNGRWDAQLLGLVREGLAAIGAVRHVGLLDAGAARVAALGPARLTRFLAGGFFGDNAERDDLAALDERLPALGAEEDLVTMNGTWLRSLPHLCVTPEDVGRE